MFRLTGVRTVYATAVACRPGIELQAERNVIPVIFVWQIGTLVRNSPTRSTKKGECHLLRGVSHSLLGQLFLKLNTFVINDKFVFNDKINRSAGPHRIFQHI